ncbi:hypothetical protein Fmac_001748 [Flemingia macrophylla]|uniref:Uncharacterized protein n=1 Tax=Flemingia macrophylla TaxID=520843 RepID=A0ABD1NJN3_9FABA
MHKAMLLLGQTVALKVMDSSGLLHGEKEFHNELNLCLNLKSPFVVLLLVPQRHVVQSSLRHRCCTLIPPPLEANGDIGGNAEILVDAGEVEKEGEEEEEKEVGLDHGDGDAKVTNSEVMAYFFPFSFFPLRAILDNILYLLRRHTPLQAELLTASNLTPTRQGGYPQRDSDAQVSLGFGSRDFIQSGANYCQKWYQFDIIQMRSDFKPLGWEQSY